jgi:hypothetical protein
MNKIDGIIKILNDEINDENMKNYEKLFEEIYEYLETIKDILILYEKSENLIKIIKIMIKMNNILQNDNIENNIDLIKIYIELEYENTSKEILKKIKFEIENQEKENKYYKYYYELIKINYEFKFDYFFEESKIKLDEMFYSIKNDKNLNNEQKRILIIYCKSTSSMILYYNSNLTESIEDGIILLSSFIF